jgi:putative membrane protein
MLLNKHIPLAYIFNSIKLEVFTFLIWLFTYYLTHTFASSSPGLPITIPTFIGTAISIILSFKLNQSYDRWWEARKVWGTIVNDSRTLVMQLQSFVNPVREKDIRTISFRQIAGALV